ncbi:MAG: hypothetical protein AAF567_01800 [Actinomycetota bacterium]
MTATVLVCLVWSLALSVLFSALIVLSWRRNPEIWTADATEGRQQPDRTTALYAWTAAITIVVIAGPLAVLLLAGADDTDGFWRLAALAYLVVIVVNLVDLFLIDIALYLWRRPAWMTIEGVEIVEGVAPHLRAFANGLAMGVPIALATAGVALVVA